MSYPLNHLGSIWYHSEFSDIPYSLNQFLGWDFFCRFLQQEGSKILSFPLPHCWIVYSEFRKQARSIFQHAATEAFKKCLGSRSKIDNMGWNQIWRIILFFPLFSSQYFYVIIVLQRKVLWKCKNMKIRMIF